MAEVIHRYVRDPQAVAEKAAEREAAEKRRQEAAERKEAAERSASRSTWRGIAGLRKEKMEHEKTKRLEREMEIAARRGELVEKEVVLRQAAFLLTALRSRCLSAPSAWCRRLLGINNARVMTEKLKDMVTEILEEIADLPQKVTAGELNDDVAPARTSERSPKRR